LKDDYSRKPNPGMILQAQKDMALDLNRSVLIGDKASDIQAGNHANIGTNLLYASEFSTELDGLRYEFIGTLLEAIPHLERYT